MKVYPLSDLLEILGEESVSELLSSLSVSRNQDVHKFITKEAIKYEKSGNARSFIFMSDALEPLGFVALALNVVVIPEEISSTKRKKITGYGRIFSDAVPGYLIGHFARFDGVPKELLSGDNMFEMIFEQVKNVRSIFGGRILAVDCQDELVPYYSEKGFQKLNKVSDLNHMLVILKD